MSIKILNGVHYIFGIFEKVSHLLLNITILFDKASEMLLISFSRYDQRITIKYLINVIRLMFKGRCIRANLMPNCNRFCIYQTSRDKRSDYDRLVKILELSLKEFYNCAMAETNGITVPLKKCLISGQSTLQMNTTKMTNEQLTKSFVDDIFKSKSGGTYELKIKNNFNLKNFKFNISLLNGSLGKMYSEINRMLQPLNISWETLTSVDPIALNITNILKKLPNVALRHNTTVKTTGKATGNANGTLNGNPNGTLNGNPNGNQSSNPNGKQNGNQNGNANGTLNGKQNGNQNGNPNGKQSSNPNGKQNGNQNGNPNGKQNGNQNGNHTEHLTGGKTLKRKKKRKKMSYKRMKQYKHINK